MCKNWMSKEKSRMIASHSVVKRTNKSVKAKSFQQIKDPRTGTREFRSALNGVGVGRETCSLLGQSIVQNSNYLTILMQDALNHTLPSHKKLLFSVPVLLPVFKSMFIKRFVFQTRGSATLLSSEKSAAVLIDIAW